MLSIRPCRHATDECRFASRRKIAPEDRPFPLHQFSYHNPDVLIDFQERNSVDPERDSGEDMTPIEPSDETAGRELALREQERTRRERIVNQEEFVDVYFRESSSSMSHRRITSSTLGSRKSHGLREG